MYREIQYEVLERVATITLNRPQKLNAWTFTMEREWRHALADAARRDDVRVIVLTGAGRGFCAGADMSLLSSIQDGGLNLDDSDLVTDEAPDDPSVPEDFKKPYSFPAAIRKPIIAAVNGPAFGIGMAHALYCDIRFASDKATFGTAFVQRGLIAEHGIAWLLPRLVGFERAMELLLSGRIVEAEEAVRIGLVSRVVPHDELMPAVNEYARHLSIHSSPRSMGIIKRQVWQSLMQGLGEASDVAIREMFESFSSADFQEGVLAYLEKRAPDFPGR